MVKTQVQIPDSLYREAKRIAAENEMSFAEVVRRGLEEIIVHHPPGRGCADTWHPPAPHDLGEPPRSGVPMDIALPRLIRHAQF